MKVVVTGGAGFIGSHAIEHCIECGDEVINVDKLTYASKSKNLKACEFVKLDVSDRTAFESLLLDTQPDYVFHFAAETHVDNSIKNYQEFIRSNVEGTAAVAMACSNRRVKLCHISTDEVYGPAEDKPFSEEDRLNPLNPYSATKAAAEMIVKSFHNTYGLRYVIVRPSNNYGPNQHEEKFIPKLLSCIEEGKKFPLYGDGSQVREWTHVSDTSSIVRKLVDVEKEWNSVYNITSGTSMTNLDVIKIVIKKYNELNGKNLCLEDVILKVEDRKGHDKKYCITSEKLKNVIEHQYVSFDTGIRHLIEKCDKKSYIRKP